LSFSITSLLLSLPVFVVGWQRPLPACLCHLLWGASHRPGDVQASSGLWPVPVVVGVAHRPSTRWSRAACECCAIKVWTHLRAQCSDVFRPCCLMSLALECSSASSRSRIPHGSVRNSKLYASVLAEVSPASTVRALWAPGSSSETRLWFPRSLTAVKCVRGRVRGGPKADSYVPRRGTRLSRYLQLSVVLTDKCSERWDTRKPLSPDHGRKRQQFVLRESPRVRPIPAKG
jgi:hypothetical protein